MLRLGSGSNCGHFNKCYSGNGFLQESGEIRGILRALHAVFKSQAKGWNSLSHSLENVVWELEGSLWQVKEHEVEGEEGSGWRQTTCCGAGSCWQVRQPFCPLSSLNSNWALWNLVFLSLLKGLLFAHSPQEFLSQQQRFFFLLI